MKNVFKLFLLAALIGSGLPGSGQDMDQSRQDVSGGLLRNEDLYLEHSLHVFSSEATPLQERILLADTISALLAKKGEFREAMESRIEKIRLQEMIGRYAEAFYTGKFLLHDMEESVSGTGGERVDFWLDSLAERVRLQMTADALSAGLVKEGMESAYDFLERYPDATPVNMAQLYSCLASIYMRTGRLEESYEYHKEALRYVEQAPEIRDFVYNNLSGWFFIKGDVDSAFFYLLRAKPGQGNADGGRLDLYYNNLACIYLALGQTDLAGHYFKESLSCIIEDTRMQFKRVDILLNLASIYLDKAVLDTAEMYVKEALQTSQAMGYMEKSYRAWFLYSQIKEQQGRSSKAYKAIRTAWAQRDSVWQRENEETVFNMKKDFEIGKIQADLELARMDNVKKRLTVTILSLVAFILLAVLVVLLYRFKKEKEEIQEQSRDFRDKEGGWQQEIEEKKGKLLQSAVDNTYKDELLHRVQQEIVKLKSSVKAESKENIEKKCSFILHTIQSGQMEDRWKTFLLGFEESYPRFFAELEKEAPALTKGEKRLAALLAAGLNAKEIAEMINRTPGSVEVFIYRLRKKLNVDRNMKTSDYFEKLKQGTM